MDTIFIVDCNNFFASCEELFNPKLKNKPVCVLGNNDGCVIARSNAAKDMGIPMGMPYFIAGKKFRNAIFISGDRNKYSEVSKKIMKKLYTFTPLIEVYSIDEAFLSFFGCEKLYKTSDIEIADRIRKEILEEIGIEVSIGIAKTKTLAKIASEIAKSNTRKKIKTAHEGVFKIDETNHTEILSNTNIEDVWGVGKNLFVFFRKHNIRNAKSYAELDFDFIKRNLGKKGIELKDELNGILAYPVIDYYTPPKSISKSSTFKECTKDKEFIKNELNSHLHNICINLRHHKMSACAMSIMLKDKNFKVEKEKITFIEAKCSEFEFYKTMHEMFEKLYKKNVIYRASGVCLFKLVKTCDIQLNLFSSGKNDKKKQLSLIWDKIEQKFGYGAISVGVKKDKPKF